MPIKTPKVTCPSCSHTFDLGETVQNLLTQEEAELRKKLSQEYDKNVKQFQKQYQEKLTSIQAEQSKKSKELAQAQASLEKQRRELLEAQESQELIIEKRVSASLEQERVKQLSKWKEIARLEAKKEYDKKALDKDLEIEELTLQLTRTQAALKEASQKSQQGSTEIEGEALENLALETIKNTFPTDRVDKTTKGRSGVDLYQMVIHNGQNCGLIVHEIKNTKNYQKEWIAKLKMDIVEKKATCAILLTKTMPEHIESGFKFEDNILIVDWFSYRLAVCMLRNQIIKLQEKSQSVEIGNRYALDLWTYVNSANFANQLEHVITRQKKAQQQFEGMRKKFATFEQSFANAIQAQEDLIGRLGAFTLETEILELPGGEF